MCAERRRAREITQFAQATQVRGKDRTNRNQVEPALRSFRVTEYLRSPLEAPLLGGLNLIHRMTDTIHFELASAERHGLPA